LVIKFMIAIDTSYWWSTSTLADPNLVAEPYLFRSLFFVGFFFDISGPISKTAQGP
jgi:type IV secretory pathway TrbL component